MVPLRTVAVIGAGPRGRSFALRCVEAGYLVVLQDVLVSRLRVAGAAVEDVLPASRDRLRLAGSVEDAVREADVAIDFVPDELESKLEIFSMMDRMAPPRTIFCTPTVLSIADLGSCTYRPERCVALEPFGNILPPTFVLRHGAAAHSDTLRAVTEWLERLHTKVQVACEPPDSRGSEEKTMLGRSGAL